MEECEKSLNDPIPSIAVIPAAGLGTRLHPITKAVPKEMFPIGKHAAIEWVINEAIESGCREAVIVINPHKKLIKEYLIGNCPHLTDRIKLHFIEQNEPRGVGHAILSAYEIIGDSPFVTLYPDGMIDAETPPLVQIKNHFSNSDRYIICLTKDPFYRGSRYRRMRFRPIGDRIQILAGIVEEAEVSADHPILVGIGRSIMPAFYWKYALEAVRHWTESELDDGDIIRLMIDDGVEIFGFLAEGNYYDISTIRGFKESLEVFSQRVLT